MNKFFLVMLCGLLLSACTKDDDMSHIQIAVMDAPADFEHLWVTVTNVEVNATEGATGWQSLGSISNERFDLLSLVNGTYKVLADKAFPTGNVAQIRLTLGDIVSLESAGKTYALLLPTEAKSGLTVKAATEIEGGTVYRFMLDFDVSKSVVSTTADSYEFWPSISLVDDVTGGSVSGLVQTAPNIFLELSDGKTVYHTFTNASGYFVLKGVTPGTYSLLVSPSAASKMAEQVVPDIVVTKGAVTALDAIKLVAF
jgi:hypothetical protein